MAKVEFTWLPWGIEIQENPRRYSVVDAQSHPIARDISAIGLARLLMYAPTMLDFLHRAATLCPATDTDTMLGKDLHELLDTIDMDGRHG